MKKKKTERKLRRRSDRHGESDGREGARRKLERFYSLKRGAQQGEMALIRALR